MLSFEAALVLVILTTMPLDEPSIQQYELFVFGELLAVSLLNARSVFPVALFNCGFIIASLLYQPHTHALNLDLHVQFWPMLVCPIGVQLLVAGVTSLWVSSATGSMTRAYKAEQAATAAQQVAERQRELSEQERKLLQESIERVVQNHANVMNQHTPTKIPLQEYEPVLWPLINVFNSLQNRLQRSQHMEKDLQQLDQAIARCTHHFYQGGITALQTLQTKTALDPLLVALREQQYRRPSSQGTIPGSPKGKGE